MLSSRLLFSTSGQMVGSLSVFVIYKASYVLYSPKYKCKIKCVIPVTSYVWISGDENVLPLFSQMQRHKMDQFSMWEKILCQSPKVSVEEIWPWIKMLIHNGRQWYWAEIMVCWKWWNPVTAQYICFLFFICVLGFCHLFGKVIRNVLTIRIGLYITKVEHPSNRLQI